MTCVIAMEHENGVALGSDSFWGTEVIKDVVDHPKFFKKGPKFYIAGAGDTRPTQIVEHELKFRRKKKDETEESYLVNHVIKKMREAFAAMEEERNSEDKLSFEFLVVLCGKAYVINSDFGVGRSKNGFCAIGSVEDIALGAMSALVSQSLGLSPTQTVTAALKATAAVSSSCSAPFHVLNIE